MNTLSILKLSAASLLLAATFASCDKDDEPVKDKTTTTTTEQAAKFLITATDSLKDLNGGATVKLFSDLTNTSRREVSVYDSTYKGTDAAFVWDGIAQVDYNPSTGIFGGNVYRKGASGRDANSVKRGSQGVHLFRVNGDKVEHVKAISNEAYASFGHFGAYTYTTDRGKAQIDRIDAAGNQKVFTLDLAKLLPFGDDPSVACAVPFDGGVAIAVNYADRDSAVVAFADNDLNITKVIADARAGHGVSQRKGARTGQLLVNADGDLYFFGGTAKHDDRVVALRIKKGTTEFDKGYAFDFGKVTNNYRVRRFLPLADGKFVVELFNEPAAKGISGLGLGGDFGILDVKGMTYTKVTGLPAGHESLYVGKGDAFGGKFYLPLSGATGILESAKNGFVLKDPTKGLHPTVYVFGADGKASVFMSLKYGNIIKGFTFVK